MSRLSTSPAGDGTGAASARARAALDRIRASDRPEVWITRRSETDVLADAAAVDAAVAAGADLPLAGWTVAVKDNIDVAGMPTTAGCPAFAFTPKATASAVARLVAAGAVVLGKTNLDQFATGLVGTRSPFGVVRNAHDAALVAGGSSSGSAVAVALGLADLGISTDTAGSGRIPAAFQGIVGLKPTLGTVSTAGVVPACRSYDCIGVFARSLAEAERALGVMTDPASRLWPADAPLACRPNPVVAVPERSGLALLSPTWLDAFDAVLERLRAGGAILREIAIDAFLAGGRLLYESAIVAERYAAVGRFIDENPDRVDPIVRSIIAPAAAVPAHELVAAREELERLRRVGLDALGDADCLLLPTAPFHPTIADVMADPIGVNRDLGTFASFANLFDLCAVSVPGPLAAGRPFGVTVFGRAFADRVAADVARLVVGGAPPTVSAGSALPLLVLGAHMSGEPLNGQLTDCGARLVGTVRTASRYELFALATVPPKPGLVEVAGIGASARGRALAGASRRARLASRRSPWADAPRGGRARGRAERHGLLLPGCRDLRRGEDQRPRGVAAVSGRGRRRHSDARGGTAIAMVGEIDLPEVVAEVTACFLAYEADLATDAVDRMDAVFWDSPSVVRFGIAECQYGLDEIRDWRRTAGGVPEGRTLGPTVVSTFGRDVGVVATEFRYPHTENVGRQSQTWLRLEGRWTIVHAHVSVIAPH